MIDKIHIYEDIVSKEKQDSLEEYFLNKTIGWKHINNTTFLNTHLPQQVFPSDNIQDENIKSIIAEIEKNVVSNINATLETNYRYKVNLLNSSDYDSLRNDIESIHIDRYEPHISMVYYINNSDGDTKFYNLNNGKIIDWMTYVSNGEYDRFSEIKSVSPKKGKIVVFNGLVPHHSTYPRTGNRYVINFNTIIKTPPKSVI
jgi:hypothetical protein